MTLVQDINNSLIEIIMTASQLVFMLPPSPEK